MKKLKKAKKPKTLKVSQLIKKLDAIFSIYIRQRDADFDGMVACFTCGTRKHWKEMQNSHYVSRMHKSTRFDEFNCQPACMPCNVFKHGAMDEYALALQRKYGPAILMELNHKKHVSKQFTSLELLKLIAHYKSLVE